MSDDVARSVIGAATERAYTDAVTQWLREHRKGRDPEVAWTADVVSVSMTTQLKRWGHASIFVSIVTKNPSDSETYPFRLERIPGRGFQVKH